MEGLELVMEGPSSLFPSLYSVGWLDGRPSLVQLCFFHRCSKLASTSHAAGPSSLQCTSCHGSLGPPCRREACLKLFCMKSRE